MIGGKKMEIFLDTANIEEIKKILPWGIISGLTTNQKIFLQEKGCNFKERVIKIFDLIDGDVSIEATSNKVEDIINEAREYSNWGSNVVIKVPMFGNGDGLKAVSVLENEGIKTNMTALTSVNQVMLAALAGATYASIFFNRVKDYGDDPQAITRESREVLDRAGFETKIIVGSIRDLTDLSQAAIAGAHVLTIPYKILTQMPYHEKTDETIKEFDLAWMEFKEAELSG